MRAEDLDEYGMDVAADVMKSIVFCKSGKIEKIRTKYEQVAELRRSAAAILAMASTLEREASDAMDEANGMPKRGAGITVQFVKPGN